MPGFGPPCQSSIKPFSDVLIPIMGGEWNVCGHGTCNFVSLSHTHTHIYKHAGHCHDALYTREYENLDYI